MPEHFLGLEDAKTIRTNHFSLTQRTVEDLARLKAIGVVHGEAGLGKTFAVKSALNRVSVPVHWFDFPGRTTTKAIVATLLYEITGIPYDASVARLEVQLMDLLSSKPRLVVIDEAQRLYDESIEYLRHLYDRPSTQFALLLVGGNDCWSRVSRYPMVRSRVLRAIAFEPLTLDVVIAQMPRYHAIYRGVPSELIERIDDEHAHGNLRNWAKFTTDAVGVMRDNDLPSLCDEVIDAVFDLQPNRRDEQ